SRHRWSTLPWIDSRAARTQGNLGIMNKRIGLAIGGAVGAAAGAIAVGRATTLGPELLRILPSLALWVLFFGYWAIESRKAAPTKGSESLRSTLIHQTLLACAIVLLPMPIPGLTGRFVPKTTLVWAIGLGIQAAFVCLGIWARRHLGRNWSAEV